MHHSENGRTTNAVSGGAYWRTLFIIASSDYVKSTDHVAISGCSANANASGNPVSLLSTALTDYPDSA